MAHHDVLRWLATHADHDLTDAGPAAERGIMAITPGWARVRSQARDGKGSAMQSRFAGSTDLLVSVCGAGRSGGKGLMMNTLRTAHASRLRLLDRTLVVLALLLLTLVAPVEAEPGRNKRAPDLRGCERIDVPAGNKVIFHVYAEGVQIYRWSGTNWTFVAPEAVLFANARSEGTVGIHYAGPTWESVSGSTVVGSVVERCTPDPDAIPWLLLGAVFNGGPGIFHRVTFIQRLSTVGGVAPTDPGNFEGEVARVPYAAEYFFYRAHR